MLETHCSSCTRIRSKTSHQYESRVKQCLRKVRSLEMLTRTRRDSWRKEQTFRSFSTRGVSIILQVDSAAKDSSYRASHFQHFQLHLFDVLTDEHRDSRGTRTQVSAQGSESGVFVGDLVQGVSCGWDPSGVSRIASYPAASYQVGFGLAAWRPLCRCIWR